MVSIPFYEANHITHVKSEEIYFHEFQKKNK